MSRTIRFARAGGPEVLEFIEAALRRGAALSADTMAEELRAGTRRELLDRKTLVPTTSDPVIAGVVPSLAHPFMSETPFQLWSGSAGPSLPATCEAQPAPEIP